ncbi:fasciclin domain-containing protein [Chlorogloea sp. CCALA 695]|uniref:fasciclin domain-containing protein n=1 Tax=Chlorogloea sp. CCALA 695 TaxID=2107693 RepID=UPI000D04F7AB|nr:fasciclin domain-containing protein [Chlorogloea sp. CCALA 695]PSB33512.1 beta-Ig-H3/fasciclin [Chlorogloea sp. CCALA 695]
MIKNKKHGSNLLKKVTYFLGIASASVLIGFPLQAQQSGGGVLNPKPSIFNEPPYNRSGGAATPPETSPAPMPDATTPAPTPETSPAPMPDATTPATTPETSPAPTPDATTPVPSTSSPTETTPGASTGSENLVALAAANGSFKTLTAALKAADLTATLEGTGPFTIFAPNDQAFAALPQEALQELLKPENKALLVKILTYHVVPGKVTSTDLKSGAVKSVEGGSINVKVDPATGVSLNNDAKVVQPDIQASNGVIHAIDKVILPPDI